MSIPYITLTSDDNKVYFDIRVHDQRWLINIDDKKALADKMQPLGPMCDYKFNMGSDLTWPSAVGLEDDDYDMLIEKLKRAFG